MLQNELLERALRAEGGEVHHDRDIRQLTCLHTAIHRDPLRSRIMGDLDADHDVAIAPGHFRGLLGIHVLGILFHVRPAAHAVADDVQHGEDARLFAIDHLIAKFTEIAPSRAAGIHHGGDAAAEREAIGANAVLAEVLAVHAAGEHVFVHVHQARNDI